MQISVTEEIGGGRPGRLLRRRGCVATRCKTTCCNYFASSRWETPINFHAEEVRLKRSAAGHAPLHPGGRAIDYGARTIRQRLDRRPGSSGLSRREQVDPQSNTETFAAFKFFVDNWRWQTGTVLCTHRETLAPVSLYYHLFATCRTAYFHPNPPTIGSKTV